MAHYSVGDEPVPGYRLVAWLGEGGFGVAWKATAPGGAEVCLKIIDLGHQAKNKKAAKERRALELVKRIRHPNLASIFAFWLKDSQGKLLDDATMDAGEPAGSASAPSLKDTMVLGPRAWQSGPAELIIAMDLGEQSLSQRLEECQTAGLQGIPIEELLQYLEGAADAIDCLNVDHNILHGDIKPQNILVVARRAKVCDYGLARTLEGTRTANVAATVAYAAPELLDNRPGLATDQYSLAITYIELRTGSLPFDDDSAHGVMRAHMEGTLNLTRLMEGEREAIRRATAVDPNDRYDSAYKMVRALRRAHEATLGTETPQTPTAPKPPSKTEEVVPGYRLVGQPVRSGMEEVWEATVPGGKRVSLSIRRLGDSTSVLDFDALSLAPKLKHQNLAEVDSFWLIDRDGMVLADEHLVAVDRARLDKLVLSGKLSNSTLLHWLGERQQRTGKGLPASELLPRMRQLANAIDYLNEPRHQVRGRKVSLLHCNVQPANLLLFGQEVRLGSLGRLRTLNADMVDDSNAAANFEATYTPPEAFDGRITRWSDQYAFALSYVHLRTGQPAFEVANSTTRLIQMRTSGKLNFRELPEREVEVLLQATALEPAERFDTCGDLVAALTRAFEKRQSDALPSPSTGTESAGKPARLDNSKTALIEPRVTKLVDDKHSSTKDTSPPEPSVTDTHPVQPVNPQTGTHPETIDPLPIEVVSDRSKTDGKGGWQPSPAAGASAHARLLVATGVLALLLALGGAVAWTHWYGRDRSPVDPFLTTLESLLDRAAEIDDQDVAGLLALDAQLQELNSDPDAAKAFDSRTRDVNEFEKRVSLAQLRQLLEGDLGDHSTAAELEQLVVSLLELQPVLDEQAADDAPFRQEIDRVYREHRRRIAELHDKARQMAQAGSDPTAAKSLLARLVQFDAENFASWLALARLNLTTGEWEAARQLVEKVSQASTANPAAVRGDSLDELRLLQAWVDFKSPVPPATTLDSLGNFKDLVDKAALHEGDVVLVSGDLVTLGERTEFTAACIDSLKTADATYPGNQTIQANLISLMERWLPQQIASETDLDPKWFEDRRNECEFIINKGDSTSKYRPLVNLLYAECLAEPGGVTDDPRAKQHLDEASAVSHDYATYATYVGAIVMQAASQQSSEKLISEKLNLLADHLGQGASSAGMSAPHRRQRSAHLFADAANRLRTPYDRDHPIEQAFTNPFGSFQNAANAAAWLQCHRALLGDPLDLQPAVNLALAAYYSALSPHPATARAAAEALLPRFSEIGDDRLAIGWILAQTAPFDEAGRRTALEQSASLVKEFAARRRLADLDVAPALLLQREVIAPALNRITPIDTQVSLLFDSVGLARAHLESLEALPEDSKAVAARLHATQGQLLLNNSERVEWKLDQVATRNKAYRAFDRATRLDSSSPEYLVARASVRRFMPKRGGAQAALKDLDAALRFDGRYAPADYQKALVLTQQAMALSLQERLQLFDSARKSCEQALQSSDAKDLERANYLVQLSNSHVNLGILNIQLGDVAKCDQHLRLAESIGQEAVRDKDGAYIDLAYRALGNAQEDLAWISARRDPKLASYYKTAADSFDTAIGKNPHEASSYRDLGRLYYRQAVDSLHDAAQAQIAEDAEGRDLLLRYAQASLQTALKKNARLNDARYWAAMTSSAQGDHLVAAEHFEQYFAPQQEFDANYTCDYVHASLQSLQNLHFSMEQRHSPSDMTKRLAATRECARRIVELAVQDSTSFDAKNASIALQAFADALESEGNAAASLATIQRALPADRAKLKMDSLRYLELLVAQVHCRLRAPKAVREAVDESDLKKRYSLYRDVELLDGIGQELYARHQTKLPVARHIPPMAAIAWGRYEVSSFIHGSESQRQNASLYSMFAIKSLRDLIAAEPHHFDGCYWRWCARQRFVAEMNERQPGQTVLRNAASLKEHGQPSTLAEFSDEFLSYIKYELKRTPVEQHGALREEERKFKELQ